MLPTLAEECAAVFVITCLLGNLQRETQSDALLCRSAAFFARNFLRAERRRQQREVPLEDVAETLPQADIREQTALRQEFWTVITKAIEQLADTQQACFIRHHLHGYTIEDLAQETSKTPHAVEQTLYRARHRLRDILERMGYDEAALREYLIP